MTPCEGCGEQRDRCRCDGPAWDEDMAFGFHIWDPDAAYQPGDEEDEDEQ